MPESRSKRKKRGRPGPAQMAPQSPRRRRTPRWVPYVFFGSLGSGALLIILNYMGIFGGTMRNSLLFVGLGLMAAGFVVSTKLY